MSDRKGNKGDKGQEHAAAPDTRTTIRAKVTPGEHEAVRRVAKHVCNTTIEDFVRQAVDAYLVKACGKDLASLAEEAERRDRFVQGELF